MRDEEKSPRSLFSSRDPHELGPTERNVEAWNVRSSELREAVGGSWERQAG